jgi:hypothetical protein
MHNTIEQTSFYIQWYCPSSLKQIEKVFSNYPKQRGFIANSPDWKSVKIRISGKMKIRQVKNLYLNYDRKNMWKE